jgi:hypothetical protein
MRNLINLLFLLATTYCQLRPPPITFTQTQTAAEKQMIGEEKELEKDGWLISSIKSSSSGPDDWKRETVEEFPDPAKRKEYYTLVRIIAYTAPEIKKLKGYSVIGEGLDGSLHTLNVSRDTKFEQEYKTPEQKKKMEDIINLVNATRKKIREFKQEMPSSKDKKEPEPKSNLEYYNNSFEGEYIEIKKGQWEKKTN